MSNETCTILFGMSVLIGQEFVENYAVVIEEGVIKALIPAEMIKNRMPAKLCEYPADHYLVPGFVDMHLHGVGGQDVMDASVPALNEMSLRLAAEGVTGFLATTMTASIERIDEVLAVIPEAVECAEGAAILGVHLEGPFIAREKMGAQQGSEVLEPDIELFKRWQKLAGGYIRLVTLAPELPQATEFIAGLKRMGVIPAIGHTNANYEQTMEAIESGCTYATHLFNAMRGLQHREPGAAGALLLADRVAAELIADGKHVHPAVCEIALRVKGNQQLLLVTDAMRAKCMGEGSYDLGGQMVVVKDGKVTLPDGTLAGSVLSMPEAIKNMVSFTNCSLMDAIRMASYNPLKQLGLLAQKGTIEAGKDADLVVLNKDLAVQLTMRGGKPVFSVEP